jgi:hypothetical protein
MKMHALRLSAYWLCVVGSFSVVVLMCFSDTCAERNEATVATIDIGGFRLEYVSERIMAMKNCNAPRNWLPWILLALYMGVLFLLLETQQQWQREQGFRASWSSTLMTGSGVLLLATSAVSLVMIIVFDHTGSSRAWHGVGVLLMLVGIAGVYIFTVVCESNCNLGMHGSREPSCTDQVLTIMHISTVALFAISVVLFIMMVWQQRLAIAVLCEYVLLLLILLLAVLSLLELSSLQRARYKAVGTIADDAQHDSEALPADEASSKQPLLYPHRGHRDPAAVGHARAWGGHGAVLRSVQ